jgi:hypothetical protein
MMWSSLTWTTVVTQTRHVALEHTVEEVMCKTIVTDPFEFHRMMDEHGVVVRGPTPDS